MAQFLSILINFFWGGGEEQGLVSLVEMLVPDLRRQQQHCAEGEGQ